jgi:hypothetical protein
MPEKGVRMPPKRILTAVSSERPSADTVAASQETQSSSLGLRTRSNANASQPLLGLDVGQDVKDAEDGRRFLLSTLLVAPESDFYIPQLVDAIFQVSAIMMQGVPRQTINALRSIAFILKEADFRTHAVV